MPSRHRLRHASTSNAPQLLLNNTKCSSTTTTTSSTSNSTIKNQKTNQTSAYNNSGTSGVGFHNNNYKFNNDGGGGGGLTEKQQRNAYLATLTKDQLKTECRKRGQKTSGNRTELLQRLGVKMSQLQKQQQEQENTNLLRKLKDNTTSNSNNDNSLLKSSIKNGSTQQQQQQQQNTTLTHSKKQQYLKDKEKEKDEREKIVIWRKPFLTIKYFCLECATLSHIYGKRLVQHRTSLMALLLLLTILGGLYKIPGRHQLFIDIIRSYSWFSIYWVGLGVLSSVGLGTGLHTFILYLGPHIASVTLAAYECNALNFPTPPYPDDIICPEIPNTSIPVNLWNIMAKVRLEAFLWGVGTALGELPPYFMAKAARLSGYDPDEDDDDDLKKFEELKKKQESGDLNILDKAKLFMERVVEKVGFFGILACASIPNPLFDLAGITCGHFLVPFWTFFGATLLGKAVIKMHIQKIFVIIAFNESLIERAVDLLILIPVFGQRLQTPFKSFLENQKLRLHRNKQKITSSSDNSNLLSKIFEKFVIAMICYFIISIINSFAQSYHKRIHKKKNLTITTKTTTINNSNNSSGKLLKKLAKD